MLNFILSLQFIFRPSYWMSNNPYSEKWDRELNRLLDTYKFTIGEHHTQLGPAIIWINNVPYACMHTDTLYTKPCDKKYYPRASVRPSRLTITRCLKRLREDDRTAEIRDDKLKKILR